MLTSLIPTTQHRSMDESHTRILQVYKQPANGSLHGGPGMALVPSPPPFYSHSWTLPWSQQSSSIKMAERQTESLKSIQRSFVIQMESIVPNFPKLTDHMSRIVWGGQLEVLHRRNTHPPVEIQPIVPILEHGLLRFQEKHPPGF
jgi:hypothetical protein